MRGRNLALGAGMFFGLAAFKAYAQHKIRLLHERRDLTYCTSKLTILPKIDFKTTMAKTDQLIFMHIPKTAGTNLNWLAQALSAVDSNFQYVRFRGKRDVNTSSVKIATGWRGAYDNAAVQLQTGKFSNANFICGHFPVGLHTFVPKARYVALVRDPFERLLSRVNFNYQRGAVSRDRVQEELLTEIDNPQTRMFAGIEYMHGECTKETLAMAKANIENLFLLVGITEETNLYIAAIAAIQNWPAIAMVKTQVTAERVLNELPEDLKTVLKEKHSFDIALYEYVRLRWMDWKNNNIKSYSEPQKNDLVLCITHEFGACEKPVIMSVDEIDQHNRTYDERLVRSKQRYAPGS